MADTPDTTDVARLRTVAEVAELAGVTVRTLHHYDRIGLLVPSERSEAEYRLYSAADIERLREILVWRRLDVPLAEIARLIDDPTADREAVLRAQLELVRARRGELDRLAEAIEQALQEADATTPETTMTDQSIIDALDGFDPADHEAEAEQRWGDTDAYRESTRRAKSYTADDWARIKAEADEITGALAALFDAGEPATGDEALAQVDAWRAHIARWFYDLTPEIQRGLGEMYVADPRFARHYDGRRAGFAAWMRDAMVAAADRR